MGGAQIAHLQTGARKGVRATRRRPVALFGRVVPSFAWIKPYSAHLARPRSRLSTLECIVATWRLVHRSLACTCISHVALSKDRFGCVEARLVQLSLPDVQANYRNRFHVRIK